MGLGSHSHKLGTLKKGVWYGPTGTLTTSGNSLARPTGATHEAEKGLLNLKKLICL